MEKMNRSPNVDPDAQKGAIEGDRPDDEQQFNSNAGALDEDGMPARMQPICEDAIGANIDNKGRESGAAGEAVDATETGGTTVPTKNVKRKT